MTEKQKYLLKLFKEVDEICKKHNLRYVMAGGTLIGVVRHEGFVPWDDDVDLYMPREDWEKFMEICKTELPPNRAIQCSEADRNYTNSFPRYGSTDTCAIHKNQIIGKDCGGEIIDVLTLDPIPADDHEYEKYRTHLMIYSDLINVSMVYGNRWEVPVTMYLRYLLSYIFLGKVRTLKKLEKIMYSYKEEDCNRYAMRWGGCPFLFDKDMMFPVKYGDFEGEKVMIPNKCSDYLIWHYGDEWSYMPPHDKREGHVAVCVEGGSYQDLRETYMPKVKKGKIRREATLRKIYNMASAKRNHKNRQRGMALKAKTAEMDLMAAIQESGMNLKEMVEKRAYRKLSRLFAGYYQVQLSQDFIGREDYLNIYAFYHPVLVEIPDEVFLAAMMTLLYTERVSKAYRMLKVKEKLSTLTPEMKQMVHDIEKFRKAAGDYEFKKMQEAEKAVDELLERYPDNPGFLKFKCRFLMERAAENRLEAERFLEKALSIFPMDGYFLKYKADIFWMNGETQKALELYAQVRENTTNGIVCLEMDRLFGEYKTQIQEFCENMLQHHAKEEALRMMELWKRILPDDEEILAGWYLARVYNTATQRQTEKLAGEIRQRLSEGQDAQEIYKKALTKVWHRLGYPSELARLRTELECTSEESELEWLAEQIRSRQIHRDERVYVYKLVGDAYMKEGQTKAAFENYKKALQDARPSYVKTELYRIIIRDLSEGSRQAAEIAKNTDATAVLNGWLDKYGSLEEIQALVKKLV